MPSFTTIQERHTVTVSTAEIELAFSLEDGGLRMLRRAGGPNVIGYGEGRPSVDVHLGIGAEWLADRTFVRYLAHTVEERDGGVELVIVIGIGPLKVYDRYRITGTLLTRRITIQNVSEDELLLRRVRLALRWVRVGTLEICRFDAPGNHVRPRVPLQVAAAQRFDVLPRRFFAPGLREGRALEPAPTQSPGLLALYDHETDETLFCWYYSPVEVALPQVEGNDEAVTLLHQVELADRLGAEVALSSGTQYILLLREPWPRALAAFQRTWPVCGLRTLERPAPWVRDAALYEVHPAQYGGFQELTAELQGLRALGLNTLCLMPVWQFANLKDRLWDGNWEASGNPYAVRDFTAIDHTLGTSADLRALVDSAHSQGLRVLLDLPLVGCALHARYVTEHPEWFCHDEHGRIAPAPDQDQIACFDWASRGLQERMLGWALEWLRAYDLDGYRVVAPRAAQPNWARGLPYHASAGGAGFLAFLDQLRSAIKEIKPDAALLGELCGPVFDQRQDFALAELAHHMFVHMALNRMTPEELGEWLEDWARVLPQDVVRVCFTESHRTRIMNPLADGLRGSRISRMLLAGMVFCGFVPMIWCGQEYAEEQYISRLLHVREAQIALRRGAVLYNAVPCDSQQVFAVLRVYEEEYLLGVLNVGPHKRTVLISLPVDTMGLPDSDYALHELFSGRQWVEEGRCLWQRDELLSMEMTLEPFGAYCFVVRVAVGQEPATESRELGREAVAPITPVALDSDAVERTVVLDKEVAGERGSAIVKSKH